MASVTLDITIDDDFNSIQEVLEQIRPAWSWADVKRKPFTTGITNKICGFYLHTDSKVQCIAMLTFVFCNCMIITCS